MKIWLVMSGEPIPSEIERPHRIGILSKMMSDAGHDVVWWTTTYDHQLKDYLHKETTQEQVNAKLHRVYLHSKTPYKKNISVNRIKNHKEVAESFTKEAAKREKPDAIFCAFPTIDLANASVNYGKENGVPVVVDVRDLWPDIFLGPFPSLVQPFIKIALSNYFKMTKHIFKHACAITGVSKKYVEFGLEYGKRTKSELDEVFPLGYDSEGKNAILLKEGECDHLRVNSNKINIWFVGTFGRTYDLSPAIEVAKRIEKTHPQVNFIFTGDGEKMKLWKQEALESKNIIFTGWVGKKELHYISVNSNIGLMAYSKGAPQGLPNKVFEYMASGLPIVSSLQSETKDLLEKEKIGFTYQANDPDDLLSKLDNLLGNERLLEEMSENSKKVFDTQFSSKIVYENLIKYLVKLKKDFKA